MRVLRVLGVGQVCILLICSLIACCGDCNENPDIEDVYITPEPPFYTGREISLQARVTDLDGDPPHCAWEAFDTGNVNVTAQVFKHGASGASVKFKADIPDTYMITVTAADLNGGHDALSFQIDLTPDIPVVSILSPKKDTTVEGIVNISVEAVDDKGVIKVEFYIDGVLIAEQNSPPFSYSWDTAGIIGAHVIEVKAYDSDGNDGISSPVRVTVKGVVNITEPADGAEVDWITEVKGTCKGMPEGQHIWVYVRPHTVGQWYPQSPPAEKADGTWSVSCRFGQEGKDQGAKFDVGVILVDEDRARGITEKLQEGDSGPQFLADPILAMITVKRR